MSEGLMVIGLDGKIADVNAAAAEILCKDADELKGKPFGAVFFEYEENDGFNQTVLDAVYDVGVSHNNIVNYYTGEKTKNLSVKTSYLLDGEKKVAVIAVISDISELYELRDAIKAMEKISRLNEQLELRNKFLSETFGRFLSDEIVRQLLETPGGLSMGGKKQELTVLMSDLRGFTVMSEKLSPQQLVSLLNHYLGEMTEIIQKHSGTIIEFIGDGIMAVFGAPVESEISAEQAVAAAVEMQMRMEEINAWNSENGYPALEMGIGINTGDVIVGNIGSEKRTKYGVCGSNVNLCGRIESYTTGGQIIISPSTRAQIKPSLDIDSEFDVKPKGVDGHITLSVVSGIGAPYNISCRRKAEPLKVLDNPLEVAFFTIDGKHTSDSENTGLITAKSEKEAIIKTDFPLSVYDNISIETGGRVFAKVIEANEDSFKVRFTSFI
ncbi:MAG: PAS domain-containing protein [Clostridia bacterium]|nr:PAS domain-containing protein [Clostridia bacterium]